MDILFTIVAVVFVGLLIAAVFTFSLALVAIFAGLILAGMGLTLLRNWWRRWSIGRENAMPRARRRDITIIEGQYTQVDRDDEPR